MRQDPHPSERPAEPAADAETLPTGARWAEMPGRTFLPLFALALLLMTLVWGPWVGLGLAFVAWQLAGRVW